MTATTKAKNAAAYAIAQQAAVILAYEDYDIAAEVRRVNDSAEGWTLEYAGSMGSTVRVERYWFTDDELPDIARRAQRYLNQMA